MLLNPDVTCKYVITNSLKFHIELFLYSKRSKSTIAIIVCFLLLGLIVLAIVLGLIPVYMASNQQSKDFLFIFFNYKKFEKTFFTGKTTTRTPIETPSPAETQSKL